MCLKQFWKNYVSVIPCLSSYQINIHNLEVLFEIFTFVDAYVVFGIPIPCLEITSVVPRLTSLSFVFDNLSFSLCRENPKKNLCEKNTACLIFHKYCFPGNCSGLNSAEVAMIFF